MDAGEVFAQARVGGACMRLHALEARDARGHGRHLAAGLPAHTLRGHALQELVHGEAAGVMRRALGRQDVIDAGALVAEGDGGLFADEQRAVAAQVLDIPGVVGGLQLEMLGRIVVAERSRFVAAVADGDFTSGIDPVTAGYVASLSQPGGNVTGVSMLAAELQAKRLGLLRDLVPKAAKVAVLLNPNYGPSGNILEEIQQAASGTGHQLALFRATSQAAIEPRLLPWPNSTAMRFLLRMTRSSLGYATLLWHCRQPCNPNHLSRARICRRRRADELRSKLHRLISPSRDVHRPYS